MEGGGGNYQLTLHHLHQLPRIPGFQAGCGTGTSTLEVNLLHQVAALSEAVLHEIFLDLHKAYDALDRFRCLDIREGYSVGPRSLRLLRRY